MMYRRLAFPVVATALSAVVMAPGAAAHPRDGHGHGTDRGDLELTLLGRYETGSFDEGAAEITAYDARTERVFTVNAERGTVDVLDISDPAEPRKVAELDTPGANSVAVHDGTVAVAQEAGDKTDPGTVTLFRARDGRRIDAVTVGALPDMLTFTPDGRRVVVVGEGEPDSYCAGGTDPEGTVSVLDLDRHGRVTGVRTADFRAWNGQEDRLREQGVRIYGPGASAAQDFEPEYAAVSPDGRTAYVTLQENNAIATVDLVRARVTRVDALGTKDHGTAGNGLDPSDDDGGAAIGTWPVSGLYEPDGIASFGGGRYLVTANEGDTRDGDCWSEEVRVADLDLSPEAFPDAAALQDDAALGRLTVTATSPRDAEGRVTELQVPGGRSLSVRDTRGRLLWDSGDDLERLMAERYPDDFNTDNTENDPDSRSDAKGPEPEGVTVGTVRGTTYAFAGLERFGGIVVYDLSDPRDPRLAGYVTSRDFGGDPEAGTAGDLGPEGLTFVPAADSPTGDALLVVGNETSGTTAIYRVG
ncbi:choice-of-anchor I family protein [Streptomyces sp. RFCAC02]|uniref:choice-of-anchor I family protein n=1 Tax=Streptomyces sp. RFCAC02 TaxID=2499143 RepID=UPI001022502E|nr:choice-of-anchor I family protein [Streptomyces sp. RFCAC02]